MPDAGAASENPVAEWFYGWCERTPFATRNTLVLLVTFYVLSLAGLVSARTFAVIPQLCLRSWDLGLHRMLLSPLFETSIFGILFVAMSFSGMGARLESMYGSGGLLALMAALGAASNFLYVAACVLLSFADPFVMLSHSAGFWPLLLALIVIECHAAPDARRRMMFLPCEVPSRYYPLAILALFSLFGGNMLPLIVATGAGYAQVYGYLAALAPAPDTLARWESGGGWLSSWAAKPGYVLQGAASGAPSVPLLGTGGGGGGGSGGGGGGGGSGGGSSGSGGGSQYLPSQRRQWDARADSGGASGGGGGGSGGGGGGGGGGMLDGMFGGGGGGNTLGGGSMSQQPGGFGSSSSSSSSAPGGDSRANALRAAEARAQAAATAASRVTGQRQGHPPPSTSSASGGTFALLPGASSSVDQQKMSQLQAMGFTDRRAAADALSRSGGDVDAAATMLLS